MLKKEARQEVKSDFPPVTKEEETAANVSQAADFLSLMKNDIPAEIVGRIEGDEQLRTAAAELAADPELAESYRSILIEGDAGVLREHSQAQLAKVMDQYFAGVKAWNFLEFRQRRKKLEAFRSFFGQAAPVRGDKPDLSFHKFVSPRQTKKAASFGQQDVIVQADNYVYGSLDQVPHYMTAHSGNNYRLQDADAVARGELVMQDVANIAARHPKELVRNYLNNTFDYQTGKEILAAYLAKIFDSPRQAADFLSRNSSPDQAQNWDRGAMYFSPDLLPESLTAAQTLPALQKKAEAKTAAVSQAMAEMYEATGIEPPLSLEVRIRDEAEIVYGRES